MVSLRRPCAIRMGLCRQTKDWYSGSQISRAVLIKAQSRAFSSQKCSTRYCTWLSKRQQCRDLSWKWAVNQSVGCRLCASTRAMSTFIASKSGRLANRAFVALGSNLGDRIGMIEKACNAMEGDHISIINTSGLWETKPMYVEDQGNFINGACEVVTSLGPMELLDRLQAIEKGLGRQKTVDKGPRSIDLDIILYNNERISNERLKVPHELMHERDFVLRPLSQLVNLRDLDPSVLSKVDSELLDNIESRSKPAQPISTVVPIGPDSCAITPLHSNRSTHRMSILNVTPDSFSDGGENSLDDMSHLASVIREHIKSGCKAIDIGGQSTRPNAALVGPDEEKSRVLPVVSLIRSMPEAIDVCISIDTFYADVARASVEAGAHMVNDISAGAMDGNMLPTLAQLGCTTCLMHMRGTPTTMNKLTDYPGGVVETVGRELLGRVETAVKAGIRRWRIIVDPGVGFAKTQDQNLELLRRLGDLRRVSTGGLVKDEPRRDFYGLPWLVGTSRKSFVGRITEVKLPRERIWGTAATVAAAVQGGADIVRVHDVHEMAAVVKMSDAIWRQ